MVPATANTTPIFERIREVKSGRRLPMMLSSALGVKWALLAGFFLGQLTGSGSLRMKGAMVASKFSPSGPIIR